MKRYAYHSASVGLIMLIASGTGYTEGAKDSVAPRVAQLIAQLGAERFVQRETASKELEAIGDPALPALRKAAASSDDVEIRRRAELIIRALAALVTKSELKKLQGTWTLTSYETAGRLIKGEDKMHVFIFDGDKWSIRVGRRVFQAGTVQRIEVKENFNAIDLFTMGSGVTGVSIYALEGEGLKYINGNPRPTEFATKEGDGRHYLTFRRAQP